MSAPTAPTTSPLSDEERRAYQMGRRHFTRGEVDEALTQFSQLLRTRSRFADVHYMVGALFERKNDLSAAARSLQEALHINPAYAEALLALASVCERQGDYERSRELAERARQASEAGDGSLDVVTQGKLANLHAELGDAYRDAGELAEAIEAYGKALDRCPGFHDIRQRLGIALREAGRPDRALAEFRRVLRGNPDFLDAAVQLGLTLYTLGRSAEAIEQWRAVQNQDPDRADARMYLNLVSPEKPAD